MKNVIPGAKRSSVKLGRLEPRDRDPDRIVSERYQPRCVVCLEPREPHKYVVCDRCIRTRKEGQS